MTGGAGGPGEAAPGAFDALLELADLDAALARATHRRAALPERAEFETASATLGHLAARRGALTEEAGPLLARRDELDAQSGALAQRRGVVEARLYGAQGSAARDLAAMQQEVEHITQRLTGLEDEELEILVALEPLEGGLAELDTDMAAAAVVVEERRALAQSAEVVVDAEIAELGLQRATVAARVPPDLAARYEQIRARAGGVGAARLVGDRCSGCHLTISAAEVDELRHQPPGTVHTCEQCGRILVVAPGPDAPGAA